MSGAKLQAQMQAARDALFTERETRGKKRRSVDAGKSLMADNFVSHTLFGVGEKKVKNSQKLAESATTTSSEYLKRI